MKNDATFSQDYFVKFFLFGVMIVCQVLGDVRIYRLLLKQVDRDLCRRCVSMSSKVGSS